MDATEKAFLAQNWWVWTLRGIAAILFGIAAVFWPGLTLVTLVYLFAAYVLVTGVFELIHGIMGIGKRGTWMLDMLFGLIAIVAGIYLVRHPNLRFATFILILGFTFIARGLIEAVTAFTASSSATERTLLILGGAVSTLAGIIVLFQPVAGGVAFVWILGVVALVEGPILIALSQDAKKLGES